MGVSQLLIAASLVLTPLVHEPQDKSVPDPVRPAMWKVSDADTTVYLFGTFHALDGSTRWFKDAVKTAFEASDQLVLETLLPKPAGAGSGTTQALPPARVSLRPGSPVAQLAPSASFLASTEMVMRASRARGMSSVHGADVQLREAADASGKPVAALESFQFQINMFSRIAAGVPRQARPAAPANGPATAKALSAMLAQLQDAWNRGDMSIFAPMMEQMRVQSPETYRTMFTERNARWAHWIAGRLEQPGTVFVAVGAGHLAGRDSVQNRLAMIGVDSRRVN